MVIFFRSLLIRKRKIMVVVFLFVWMRIVFIVVMVMRVLIVNGMLVSVVESVCWVIGMRLISMVVVNV